MNLKHDYPSSEWRNVPLGHWNWIRNQARSNYSTYDQELLAVMLVLSSQSQLLGSNPIVWFCDQQLVKSFQNNPPPEKAKLNRWWTYLSQFRLTVHHISGIQNELSDWISRNNFDALIGESSEAIAKEAFQLMDFLHYASPQPRGAGGCVTFHSRLSSLRVVGFCKLQGQETQKTKPFWMMLWYINTHSQ